MPYAASYTSGRFVGREEAFARLARRLDDAAHGRTRTMLLGGTAGVGVTRFLDEAIERMRALREPMTVLRATAWPSSADEPYGPIVRAIGPALRDCPDDPGRPPRAGDVRGHPAAPRPRRRARAIGARRRRGPTAPERRQARTLEGVLGLLGRMGDTARSCSSSRTCTSPMPPPGR